MTIDVVVIGGRGYTGGELLPLLFEHPDCRITAVGSSSVAAQAVNQHVKGIADCSLKFSDIQPHNLSEFPADLYVLALPNGLAGAYVEAIDESRPDAVVIDISADYRFDTARVHDSQHIDELIENEHHGVFADSAYMDKKRKARLHEQGICCGIIQRKVRGQKKTYS